MSCYLKWAGYIEVGLIGKGGHSHPCGAQESYEDAQKRTTSLFNVLLNRIILLYSVDMTDSRASFPVPGHCCLWTASTQTLKFPWLSRAGQLLALLACYLSTGLGNETVVSYLHFCGNLRQAHLLSMSSSTSRLALWMLKDNMKEQWEVNT